MEQELFVVKSTLGLRGLPAWLVRRSYNVVRYNMADHKGTPLVGLSVNRGGYLSKAGIICVYEKDLLDKVIEICKCACTETATMVDAQQQKNEVNFREQFLQLLDENEDLMDPDAALTVTCIQMGITEEEGQNLATIDEAAGNR